MELPVYEFLINEDEDSGVRAVAFVEFPATESNWQTFSKDKSKEMLKHMTFKIENEEKRIVSGAMMIANLMIPRHDEERGDFNCFFGPETIEEIRDKFMHQANGLNVNEDHDPDKFTKGAFLIEGIIIDEDRGTVAPKGFEDLSQGSWWATYKIIDDELWGKIKDGSFKGFSVEGSFDMEKTEDDSELIEMARMAKDADDLITILEKLRS